MKNSAAQLLTEPDEAAKKRSRLLQMRIKDACEKKNGWIRFSEFMNIALYEPGTGYYSGGLQKFGEKGDFITAPEVSSFFGQCLAKQVSEILLNMKKDFANDSTGNSDNKVYCIEFGAGSGVLAVDILLELEQLQALPDKYLILELSAELQHRQKQTIKQKAAHLYDCVQWLDGLPDNVPNAIVIANEVLDAMPVECFRIADAGNVNDVELLMVGLEDDRLVARYSGQSKSADERLMAIRQRSEIEFSDNYCSEFNPAIHGWLSSLESRINSAVVLLIDYGYNEKEYYHPDRTTGTLMCYYHHKAHSDYLWWPGLQDITAFVNFTDIAYSAVDLDMGVSGYTTQAAFLLANGLSELHARNLTDDVQQQIKLSQQIKTLTLPSEMGDRFKVMALTKNYDEPLTGFSMLDLRNRL